MKKKKTLIIDQEMDKDLIAERYQSFIKDSPVDMIMEQDFKLDEEEDYDGLVSLIKKNGYELIVFDTFITIHTKNENDSNEMAQVSQLLMRLIKDTDCTIVYLHHHRKKGRDDNYGTESARGSTEIIAKAASHIVINSNKVITDDAYVLNIDIMPQKARRVETMNPVRVQVTTYKESKKSIWQYLGETSTSVEDTTKVDLMNHFKANEGQSYSRKDLAAVFPKVGERTLYNALKRLVDEGRAKSAKDGRRHVFWWDERVEEQRVLLDPLSLPDGNPADVPGYLEVDFNN